MMCHYLCQFSALIAHRNAYHQTLITVYYAPHSRPAPSYLRSVESKLLAGEIQVPTIVYNQTTTPVNAANGAPRTSQTEKQERGKAFRQIVAAFIANTGTLNTGLVFGFSAVAIPQLKSLDSPIQIDMVQASWIGE